MRRLQLLLYMTAALLTLTACNNEDDLDEIFVGKTWYMTSATVDDITNFYTSAGSSAYYITFSSTTFQGVLSAGNNFSGTWEANGKNQTIRLNFTKKPSTALQFDKDVYDILSTITSYKSGADWLIMKQNGNKEIRFGDSRDKVYN